MRPIRWLSVVVPVIAVAIIELVSDGLLDAELPFPMDTIVVVVVVAILAWGFSTIAFRRIEQLSPHCAPGTWPWNGAPPPPGPSIG